MSDQMTFTGTMNEVEQAKIYIVKHSNRVLEQAKIDKEIADKKRKVLELQQDIDELIFSKGV